MTRKYEEVDDFQLTVTEVANRARTSKESVERLLRAGKLPGKRVAHDHIVGQYRWAVGFSAIDRIADMRANGEPLS